MPQINVYVSPELEKEIRRKAKHHGRSLSSYLTLLMQKKAKSKKWPKRFFQNVIGSWQGEFPEVGRPWPESGEG